MPHQINYPESLLIPQARPNRLSDFDTRLLTRGYKQVLFGQTEDDLVEVYFYDSDNNIDTHINLYAPNESLTLSTLVDPAGNTRQVVNVDLPKVAELTNIMPGRYTMVLNFFRDEVGSESGNHLYIKDISPSRTEIKLVPFNETPEIFREMYEFIVPSVTKLYAQALIDEIYGKSLDALASESITFEGTLTELSKTTPNIAGRLGYSGTMENFKNFFEDVITLAHQRTLQILQTGDRNVQEDELRLYVSQAVVGAVAEIKNKGFLDPKIDVR
jgi:hypothetical protein